MIYNLEQIIDFEVIKNGVYESLSKPCKDEDYNEYMDKIDSEIMDCPYLHCPDYNLLIPLSSEVRVVDDSGRNLSVGEAIYEICEDWWLDED